MSLKLFSNQFKAMINGVAVHKDKIVVNGSFQNSLYASDIDLYEHVRNLSMVWRRTKAIIEGRVSQFSVVTLLKVKTSKEKIEKKNPSSEHLSDLMHKVGRDTIEWVRIEGIAMFLVYPIEISVIYDFKKHSGKEILKSVFEKISKKKYRIYKLAKRGLTIAHLLKHQGVTIDTTKFDQVVKNDRLGTINLHATRLNMLKKFGKEMDDDLIQKIITQIIEDLRRLGVHTLNPTKLFDMVDRETRKILTA